MVDVDVSYSLGNRIRLFLAMTNRESVYNGIIHDLVDLITQRIDADESGDFERHQWFVAHKEFVRGLRGIKD